MEYNEIEVKRKEPQKEQKNEVAAVDTGKREPVKAVAKGRVKKKPLFKRVVDALAPEGGYKNAAINIYHDTVVPTTKEVSYNVINNLIYSVIFKDSSGPNWRRVVGNGISSGIRRGGGNRYDTISTSKRKSNIQSNSNRGRSSDHPRDSYYDIRDIIITAYDINDNVDMKASMEDAKYVLQCLDKEIQRYGNASVAVYYDLVDIPDVTPSWADENYGWEDITRAQLVRIQGEGVQIVMPEPEQIRIK